MPALAQNGTAATKTVCTIAAGCVNPVVQSQGNNVPNKDAKRVAGNATIAGGISSSDTVLAITPVGSSGGNPTMTPSGTVIIQDDPAGSPPAFWEAMDYTGIEAGNSCVSGGTYVGSAIFASLTKSGNCVGSQGYVLTGLARGVRRAAGYEDATAHPLNARVYQAAPNPRYDYVNPLGGGTLTSTLTLSPPGDNPSTRHVARNYAYSTTNHMIIMIGGYHENITFSDTWFLCLGVGGKCTSGLVAKGWQQMITPHLLDGSNAGRQEVTTVFDDTNNAFFLFGGLQDPDFSHPGLWVNCPVTNAAIGCTAANDWFKVTGTTCTGADCLNNMPKWRHGAEMRYMPDSGKILMFGGSITGSASPVGDIWTYNAATKAWVEGTVFPGTVGNATFSATFWPSFAYDTAAHLGVLYAGPGLLYTYDPTGAGTWTLFSVAGGPTLDDVNIGEPSRNLEYDAASATVVFVQQGGNNGTPNSQPDTWELPSAAYTGSIP
jgi:hypothetical protein